jgi:hypothetical protein
MTSYEVYINKIRGGFVKNSQDQAFDDNSSIAVQTLPFDQADFTNQAPQDYAQDLARITKADP